MLLLPIAFAAIASGGAPGVLHAQPAQPAQGQIRVTGTVTAGGTGVPIEGVTVRVQGTQIGASTNAQGRYTVLARSATDTLVFARIGAARQVIPIDGRTRIDVTLQSVAVSLQSVAVLGYQSVPTEQLTGAIAEVNPNQIQAQAAVQNSPIKALQGRVAGVTINENGDPGDLGQVRIRGFSTLGNQDPLYVIDGIPSQSSAAQQLKPEDIETLQVLKDAASASIYGSRASNGVIVITTKSGANRRTQVSVGSHVTTSGYQSKLSVLNTEQRGAALFQAAINDGSDPKNLPIYTYDYTKNGNGTTTLNRVIVPKYVGGDTTMLASNTDWWNQVTQTGIIQEQTLQANTSNERGAALLSLGYYGNQGIVRGTDLKRFNGRINSSYNFFNNRLTVGENMSVLYGSAIPLPSGAGGNPLALSLLVQPILPVHTTTGGWGGPTGAGFDDRDNPVMLLNLNSFNRNNNLQGLGNVFAQYNLTPDLQANARFGIDHRNTDNTAIFRTYQAGFLSRTIASLNQFTENATDWTFNSTLNYNHQFGVHNVRLLAGFEAVNSSYANVNANHQGYAIETRDYFTQNAGTGLQTVAGDNGGYALASVFGKADYDYLDRYLGTVTLRDDGSSRFGANNRYGLFPSATVGWRVSKEPFFPAHSFVSDLKLRYGYGETGNQAIPNNAQYSLYVPGYGVENSDGSGRSSTAYDIHGQNTGTLPSGFYRTQTGNANLRWEGTRENNYGADYSLFGGHVNGSVDVFARTTSNILITPSYAAVIGQGGNETQNGATIKVRGAEASARYDRSAGALTWGLGVNVGTFKPKITSLPAAVVGSYPGNGFQTILGHSPNEIFGYVVQGIFQNQAEVDAAATQPGKGVGRLRYKDLNGDGVVNSLDQTWLGTTDPKFTYGINPTVTYRRFTLNVLLQGAAAKVYNGIKTQTDFTSIFTGANFGTRVLDAWTPQNPTSTIPALTLSNGNDEARTSTYFVENGSYLKLREVVVGYTLPQGGLPRGLSLLAGARAYVRGGNLFTVKGNTTLPDPEIGFANYPLPRTFTVGLDLSY
ncbi:MAG TPA: SusC/RagA family TonB-linked outer membrane protein [Gemmatirosa sp.]